MQPCGISNSQVVCLHYFCSLLTLSSITFCPSHKKKTTVESVHEPMERERQEFGQRATEYHTLFETATSAFEAKCASIKHRKCDVCQIVTLQDIFKTENLCKSCARTNSWTANFTSVLPLWTNEDGVLQYDVPEELSCLSEGEKLLIQQISVYVPLHHLKYGQLGAQGQIVSFPQDITEICKQLPRLPNDVSLIRVIKSFQLQDGEISSKSFMIHKEKVLSALRWLKKFNVLYADIEIIEENMSWIENGINQQLPPTIVETIVDHNTNTNYGQEDRGPAEGQIAGITDTAQDIEPSFGTIRQFNAHLPKVKDSQVVQSLTEAEKTGKSSKNVNQASMQFPYVSPDPISEYTERHLF